MGSTLLSGRWRPSQIGQEIERGRRLGRCDRLVTGVIDPRRASGVPERTVSLANADLFGEAEIGTGAAGADQPGHAFSIAVAIALAPIFDLAEGALEEAEDAPGAVVAGEEEVLAGLEPWQAPDMEPAAIGELAAQDPQENRPRVRN